MTDKVKRAINIFGVLAITAVVWWLLTKDGDDNMIIACARNFDGMKEHEPFPDDIEAIEKRWGMPIPDDLLLIGGVDWFSWAKICRDNNDPEGIFRGEVMDLGTHYIGRFRHEHPENRPLPENVFRNYRMSSLSGADVKFSQNVPPPVDYFRLVAIDPDGYRQPIINE